jgi:hypothetical protein
MNDGRGGHTNRERPLNQPFFLDAPGQSIVPVFLDMPTNLGASIFTH